MLDPALESADAFAQSLYSPPNAIPLLTMIRLNDQISEAADARGALPLVPFAQKQKLLLWPLYRKNIDQRIDELKRMSADAESRSFLGKGVKDAAIRQVAAKYASLFSCTVALSEAEDMVFTR